MVSKTTKISVSVIALITIATTGVYVSGLFSQNSSQYSPYANQKDVETYTGYLVRGNSFGVFLGTDMVLPSGGNGEYVRLTFEDDREFIANRELLESREIALNSTCIVYYNISQPTIVLDILSA